MREVFNVMTIYPYNNGENDNISGRVEIRDNVPVFVMPNNAQLELIK